MVKTLTKAKKGKREDQPKAATEEAVPLDEEAVGLPDDENEEDPPEAKAGEKKDDFPFTITRPGADQVKALRLLVHGDPGIGKTFLCGTAADSEHTSPVLFVDTEGGTLSIAGKDVDVIRVDSWQSAQQLVVHLRRNKGRWKTIVIDSLTELQKMIMADILKTNMLEGKRSHDPDIPEMRDWGRNSERIRKFVRALRDLPDVHVIFTCLSKDDTNEQTGRTTVRPMLPGKLAFEIPGFIDVVGHLSAIREKDAADKSSPGRLVRQMMFQPVQSVIVKDRSASLGDIMKDPTIPKIVDTILAKLAKVKD